MRFGKFAVIIARNERRARAENPIIQSGLLLKANDYLDLITIIMLAMGLIFQMPAITYVLARIGLVTAGWMIRTWKIALIVILIVAAVVSPTNDIPNMMLFAAPMILLYIVSIFIAWLFAKKRRTDAEADLEAKS